MGVFYFLDVGQGDCSIIEHMSSRVTMLDVCKARAVKAKAPFAAATTNALAGPPSELAGLFGLPPPPRGPFATANALGGLPAATSAPFGLLPPPPSTGSELSKLFLAEPDYINPIEYLRARNICELFRYIQSHTDMDHMDGLGDLFAEFPPVNFWDTDNTCKKDDGFGYGYRREDWELYKSIRDGAITGGPRRLVLYAGAQGALYNAVKEPGETHDGLYVLAPTPALVRAANECQDFNDCSYVVLWWSRAGRILFCGDSHDATWEHIRANYADVVANVEIMIAPHHGRDSDRDRKFLDIVRPKLTLFGRAPSEHLAYDAWRNRGLKFVTANQAGTVVVNAAGTDMQVYVAKEAFARKQSLLTWHDDKFGGWYLGPISQGRAAA